MSKKAFASTVLLVLIICVAIVSVNRSVSAEQHLVLRRVVLLQFKDTTSQKEVNELENAICTWANEYSMFLSDFEWGTNVNQENMDQGYTHCFLMTFAALCNRDNCLPEISKYGIDELVEKYVEKKCMVEYWTKN